MASEKAAGEDIGVRRRRLRYRAWHRGTREMDLILGPFADAHVEGFDAVNLDRLEAVLGEEDTDLMDWLMGRSAVPASADRDLVAAIIAFKTRLAEQ